MPGPPKQFDREAALAKTMAVFWRRGYEATSIEDLVKAAGINRSSMYATFGGKQAMFRESLQLYGDMQLAEFSRLLQGRGKPLNRVRKAFVHFVGQMAEDDFHGCFAGNAAMEMGRRDAEAGRIMRSTMMRWVRVVKDVLDEAVTAGDLPASTDSQGVATFLLTFAQGLGVIGRVFPAGELSRLIDSMINAVVTGDWTST